MTENRFNRTITGEIYDSQNDDFVDEDYGGKPIGYEDGVIILLNTLHEENVKLQARNKYLATKIQRERASAMKQHEKWENEIQKENEQLKQFKEKVFVLLDEKIKHYEHKPFSAPVGQPMSVNFDADVDRIARLSELQDLKKELQE